MADRPRPVNAGAVTSDHPLATRAGAAVLAGGGNAMDAALTMAAVLCVVRPHMNGIGGDCLMLVRDGRTREVVALNGAGRSGSRATIAHVRGLGHDRIPSLGPLAVSVPGAVRAWADAHERFASRPWGRLFDEAIAHATEGFPVSARLAGDFAEVRPVLDRFPDLARIYAPGGQPLAPGAILRQPELAASLARLANEGPDALYHGPLGDAIAATLGDHGLLERADLANHRSSWHEPIELTYRGHRVLTPPPSCQGLTLLEMLNFARWAPPAAHGSPEHLETLLEAAHLAHRDRGRYLADPDFADVPVARLLSEEYARQETGRSGRPAAPLPRGNGDTVYAAAIDREGNAVSLLQSLFNSFGSGVVAAGTGIVLHNRGLWLWLDAAHPNALQPAKRPFHTLCPALSLHPDGRLHAVFGTPGGAGQPQTLFQVLEHLLAGHRSAQEAVDEPRWQVTDDRKVLVEAGFPADLREELRRRGHDVAERPSSAAFGGAQMLRADDEGRSFDVGADHRREAAAQIVACPA